MAAYQQAGSTAAVVLMVDHHLYIGNVGDSRVVVVGAAGVCCCACIVLCSYHHTHDSCLRAPACSFALHSPLTSTPTNPTPCVPPPPPLPAVRRRRGAVPDPRPQAHHQRA